MKKLSLKQAAQWMKELDFCMMTTIDGRGSMHSRPMSNNREVEYNGETFFFSLMDTGKVRQIQQSPRTSLIYQGKDGLFIEVYGESHLIQQKTRFQEHWSDDLNAWFKDGIETEGLCLIRVKAHRIHYWQKGDEGMLELD